MLRSISRRDARERVAFLNCKFAVASPEATQSAILAWKLWFERGVLQLRPGGDHRS
jgi:hypothetical protein